MVEPDAAAAAADAAISALRQQGAMRLDPLRFAYLQAFARRTAAHHGAARKLLDRRLHSALDAMASRLSAAPARASQPSVHKPLSPLASLVQQVDQQSFAPAWAPAATAARPVAELKALRHFRSSWARLGVDQQLSRTQAKAPVNAGPLNSQRVVLRSLQAMRKLSPAYLGQFMGYLDTLAWLDAALHGDHSVNTAASPGQAGAQPGKKRKTARSKGT